MKNPEVEVCYLSACQAARILGISPGAVRRRISRGQLRAVRDSLTRRYRIAWADAMGQLEEVRPESRPAPLNRPIDPVTLASLERMGLAKYLPVEGGRPS